MITKVEFTVIRDHELEVLVLPIEHDFEVLPTHTLDGVELPETSIEYQVMVYLDELDKSKIMEENDIDLIIDYKIYTEVDEVQELYNYLQPLVDADESMRIPLESVISESRDILFGCGKTVEQKAHEVIRMVDISYKAAIGALKMINDMLGTKKIE